MDKNDRNTKVALPFVVIVFWVALKLFISKLGSFLIVAIKRKQILKPRRLILGN